MLQHTMSRKSLQLQHTTSRSDCNELIYRRSSATTTEQLQLKCDRLPTTTTVLTVSITRSIITEIDMGPNTNFLTRSDPTWPASHPTRPKHWFSESRSLLKNCPTLFHLISRQTTDKRHTSCKNKSNRVFR